MKVRVSIFVVLALAAVLWGATAQAQAVKVTATMDKTEMTTDDVVTLSVTVSGDNQIETPDLPPLDGLIMVSNGYRSYRETVGGVTTHQFTFTYTFQATRTGRLTINSVTVNVNGIVHATDPITIEVTQGSNAPGAGGSGQAASPGIVGQDYFVEAEVDNTRPYIGEQVLYTFRFYRAVEFFGELDYDAPAFAGLWNNQRPDQELYQSTLAGRRYTVIEIRTILFPIVTGQIVIDSASVRLPRNFFSQRLSYTTEPVTLDVRPLPSNAPPGFSGAVGRFRITSDITPKSGVANEPLTMKVTVDGQGNIDTLPRPDWPEMTGCRAFDNSVRSNTWVTDNRLEGSVAHERLLIPGSSGDFTIPAVSYTFFDPLAGEYRTVATTPIEIAVAPAGAEAPIPSFVSTGAGVPVVPADIRNIKPAPAAIGDAGSPMTSSPVYWAAWAVPAMALAGVVVWQRRRKRDDVEAPDPRSLNARHNAMAALDAASASGGEETSTAVERAVYTYIGDKFGRNLLGITQSALTGLLETRGISLDLVTRVNGCLNACAGARYAPSAGPPSGSRDLYSEARAIISDLEKEIGP